MSIAQQSIVQESATQINALGMWDNVESIEVEGSSEDSFKLNIRYTGKRPSFISHLNLEDLNSTLNSINDSLCELNFVTLSNIPSDAKLSNISNNVNGKIGLLIDDLEGFPTDLLEKCHDLCLKNFNFNQVHLIPKDMTSVYVWTCKEWPSSEQINKLKTFSNFHYMEVCALGPSEYESAFIYTNPDYVKE